MVFVCERAIKRDTKIRQPEISTYLTIIPEISDVGSVYLKFDFQENSSHDSLQSRPMCCTERVDVQYDLSLYGCIKLLELNDFSVVFATTVLLTANPTVAPSCD